MSQLESFSTAGLDPRREIEYWNDLTGSAFTPLVTDPVDRRSYIEAHLHDPALTPGRVAAAVHLSARRLHQLFEGDGETVGSYILRRRLEECARAISDAAQRSRTVTEIAFLHGFNNASHFGRVFRERYRATPSDYRRRAIELTRAALPGI